MIEKPRGKQGAIEVFGNPMPYADNPAGWERKILVLRKLPTALPFAGYPGQVVTRFRAHALVADHLLETLTACLDAGVPASKMAFGGIYAWRLKRGSASPSVHTWGVAIDVDPANNPLGRSWEPTGRMLHAGIIRVFQEFGWKWGNDWSRPDPMHWQWLIGY